MKSILTEKLSALGFFCGIELELYIQDTGNYTSLIIEGTRGIGESLYRYDFYKQTFSLRFPNQVTVYGENMTASMLLHRVKRYMLNRQAYLTKQGNK